MFTMYRYYLFLEDVALRMAIQVMFANIVFGWPWNPTHTKGRKIH